MCSFYSALPSTGDQNKNIALGYWSSTDSSSADDDDSSQMAQMVQRAPESKIVSCQRLQRLGTMVSQMAEILCQTQCHRMTVLTKVTSTC